MIVFLEKEHVYVIYFSLKTSRIEHKTNDEVLQLVAAKPTAISSMKKMSIFWAQRVILEGKIEGRRCRERPRVKWIDNINNRMNLNYCDCMRLESNREE